MYHSLLIHSPTAGHLGCLLVLAIIIKASVNTYVQIYVLA